MRITASTTGLAGKFAAVPLAGPALMREVGDLALSLIRQRTEAGVDVNLSPFRPLSEGYAKAKQAELGHSRADLVVSGRMLNEMVKTAVGDRSVTLGFLGGSVGGSSASGRTLIQRSRAVPGGDKALFHMEGRVPRKFFGLNEVDRALITERVKAYWSRVLR